MTKKRCGYCDNKKCTCGGNDYEKHAKKLRRKIEKECEEQELIDSWDYVCAHCEKPCPSINKYGNCGWCVFWEVGEDGGIWSIFNDPISAILMYSLMGICIFAVIFVIFTL